MAFQEVNPFVLEKMDGFSDIGTSILHEVTEAYQGAKISAERKASSPEAGQPNSVYKEAHGKASVQPQVYQKLYDKEGNETQNSLKATNAVWYIRSNVEPFEEQKIQSYP